MDFVVLGVSLALGCFFSAFLTFGAPAFVADAQTIALVRRTAIPMVFLTTLQLTLTTTLDGCLVGSKARRGVGAPRDVCATPP